jgi:hypothetical protein
MFSGGFRPAYYAGLCMLKQRSFLAIRTSLDTLLNPQLLHLEHKIYKFTHSRIDPNMGQLVSNRLNPAFIGLPRFAGRTPPREHAVPRLRRHWANRGLFLRLGGRAITGAVARHAATPLRPQIDTFCNWVPVCLRNSHSNSSFKPAHIFLPRGSQEFRYPLRSWLGGRTERRACTCAKPFYWPLRMDPPSASVPHARARTDSRAWFAHWHYWRGFTPISQSAPIPPWLKIRA